MGTCLFVASGLAFRLDDYLKGSSFKPHSTFYKGQIPPKDNPHQQPRPDSGFVVVVAQGGDEADVNQHLPAAWDFLQQHAREIQRARSYGGDNFLFDFGIQPNQKQTAVYLPPPLLTEISRLGMGVIFSAVVIGRG